MAPSINKMAELAAQHLMCESVSNPGERFLVRYPGFQASLDERRRYVHAFLEWMIRPDNFETLLARKRENAERLFAVELIQKGIEEVSTSKFEFYVDWNLWALWFMRLPKERKPRWAFPKKPKREEGEGPSQRFADLLEEYNQTGTLFPDQTTQA
ncbi:hypothetical protein FALBO_13057 [Fusarium albosuccineum]|uniref:Uncharacterized protein n=1 Tax=Fusarium albosuccineum TaxID=1237068 RepID=A0A8H4PGN6_9HYPO|nr:hypothetical protein FALBO_13057 [Fusarium albosuccineum]